MREGSAPHTISFLGLLQSLPDNPAYIAPKNLYINKTKELHMHAPGIDWGRKGKS